MHGAEDVIKTLSMLVGRNWFGIYIGLKYFNAYCNEFSSLQQAKRYKEPYKEGYMRTSPVVGARKSTISR